jgi:DNA-binding NtrC family response regulator
VRKVESIPALVIQSAGAAQTTAEQVARVATEVHVATSIAEARALLAETLPALAVLDLDLDEEAGFELLSGHRGHTPAWIVVSDDAEPIRAFRLGQLGVRSYLPKPLDTALLERALHAALEHAPDLTPHLRAAVGHLPVHEIERMARKTMMTEALARSRGSKTGAAKLLCVSRQLLQHMVRGQKRAC